jgi:hypothetical protein
VFTARYALSPSIKQIRFVFKGLSELGIVDRLPEETTVLLFSVKCPDRHWGPLSPLVNGYQVALSPEERLSWHEAA